MEVRKIISYVIDGLLLLIIGLFIYTEVSMMTSKDKNYGVPRAFGVSLLCVATDSMDTGTSDSLAPRTGIVIQSVNDVKSLNPSKEISVTEEGVTYQDYDLSGDIVTFYYYQGSTSASYVDTHRVIAIHPKENGHYEIWTMGDNPILHEKYRKSGGTSYFEKWDSEYLIGKVTYHSRALGELLIISSPSVASTMKESAWLFPLMMIVPIVIIAATYMIDEIIKYRKYLKDREAKILDAMAKAGIDPNDEVAVETFRIKEEMRLDYLEEKEKMLEEYRKEYLKAKAEEEKILQAEKEKLRKEHGQNEK